MKKILKICVWTPACLVTLIVLFYTGENWRGARAWNQTLAELRAKGYPVTIAETIPPPVADDENIAAAPIFAELFAAGGDLNRNARLVKTERRPSPRKPGALPMMSKGEPGDLRLFFDQPLTAAAAAKQLLAQLDREWTPLLAEAHASLQRPRCRWPLAYERGFETPLPYLKPALDLAGTWQLRALCHLELGNPEAAVDDLADIFKLAQILGNQRPLWIDVLVAVTLRNIANYTIWSGLVHHQWRAADLARLQTILAADSDGEIKNFTTALANERTIVMDIDFARLFPTTQRLAVTSDQLADIAATLMVKWMSWRPDGEILLEKCFYARRIQNFLDQLNPGANIVSPQMSAGFEQQSRGLKSLLHPLTRMAMPTLSDLFCKLAQAKATGHQAVLACALERYRLRHGKLPLTLDELAPEFLEKIPNQATVSAPMLYRRVSDRDYLLYSIGWNPRDDGGVASGDAEKLDWVWASRPELYRIVKPE